MTELLHRYSFKVGGSEINQHGIRFYPVSLTILMSDIQAMELIECLAYRLSHKQPIRLVYAGSLISEPPDPLRCPVCGWPIEDGGNCSYCGARVGDV